MNGRADARTKGNSNCNTSYGLLNGRTDARTNGNSNCNTSVETQLGTRFLHLVVQLPSPLLHSLSPWLVMETPVENSELTENVELQSVIPSDVVDQNHHNAVSSPPNDRGIESKNTIAEEEVKSILEVIAATGKYWHDWNELKNMFSFYLKQVLSEYPEAKMTTEQQTSSLGETYMELVKRLDDDLHSFVDGPPFTLQRLSEILLAARSIYSNLSKLAFALEKNLSVTSTLTISTDPYPPPMIQIVNEPEKGLEEPQQLQANSERNGVEPMVVDRDETAMSEITASENEISNNMMLDMSAFETLVGRPPVEPVSRPTDES
ncbi:serine/threonine-protein phosphatase 4 regulatory subunit 2 [Heracleum sosnowskyi]|uniref:Serine/threonine-protein phosphatase 4 regulatory subunit 2 n=1 Tax=Heracleum sosnowskyi TaxID=360622 RepID=A0AAD8HHK9_9APIA|nr:serine/threonine-protein phosphatase 4 regulatory subunit 2 [Heracleum sosnowskyi]